MEYLEQVRNFVISSFEASGDTQGLKHFDRTVYWIEQLDPAADEALRIAAVAHDVERAFRDRSKEAVSTSEKGFKDDYYLKYHPEKGAEIIGDFLESKGAPKNLTNRAKMLIEKHEVGGNDDQNLLKDADSISYFENQVEHFITKKAKETGFAKVKEKFDWMFDRITSDKAKEIARPMYQEAITNLEKATSNHG